MKGFTQIFLMHITVPHKGIQFFLDYKNNINIVCQALNKRLLHLNRTTVVLTDHSLYICIRGFNALTNFWSFFNSKVLIYEVRVSKSANSTQKREHKSFHDILLNYKESGG